MVETRVTTLGSQGARIERRGQAPVFVDVCKPDRIADPTGVGDNFRSGFLAGLSWGLNHERCAQIGSLLATYCLENKGTQEYRFDKAEFLQRLGEAYGASAAIEIEPHLHPRLIG